MADEQITTTSTGKYLPERELAGEAVSSREVIVSKDKMLQDRRQYTAQQQALLAQQAAMLANGVRRLLVATQQREDFRILQAKTPKGS